MAGNCMSSTCKQRMTYGANHDGWCALVKDDYRTWHSLVIEVLWKELWKQESDEEEKKENQRRVEQNIDLEKMNERRGLLEMNEELRMSGTMEQPLIPEFKLGRTKGLQGTAH
jgi:arylsulfatase A-like enzyme